MRRSHGSLSSFCSARPPSLAPIPRPPYFVVVGSDVLRYESYSNGQFCPHTFGSAVSSVTSTSRTNGCLASCFRSKMLVRRAARRTVTPPTPTKAARTYSQFVRFIGTTSFPSRLRRSSARAVARARMTVHAVQLPPKGAGTRVHGLDEGGMAAHAVLAHDHAIAPRDLDRLLEVLKGERHGVPESVVRFRDPLGQSLRGQMALDTGGGVPVPTLQPSIVLLVHHVTVHARSRIGREIRKSLGVHEREAAEARRNPEETGEDDEKTGSWRHVRATGSRLRHCARCLARSPACGRSRRLRPRRSARRAAAPGTSSGPLP